MKLSVVQLAIAILFLGSVSQAQVTCDSIAGIAGSYLNSGTENSIFISDGQVYRAFLQDDEAAEFNTTFFGGSTYRIAVSAGQRADYVIFEIWDEQDMLLFSNVDQSNAPYWDFKITSTMQCKIQTRLDPNKKSSGCAILLIGFEKSTY
ncbi:MAG: hypothetical protein HOL28_03925 [Crocinitomicaceae bacterium]|jgi:hypothetical protein|nr:hypothetical protein [Crocinitomicaceae bacterium]MBT5402571.1 hypothetical protein [Crocinitomicaceae bacterium]MBT6515964.1 hypothetical protein [Crocinitomicaceae bacterium]